MRLFLKSNSQFTRAIFIVAGLIGVVCCYLADDQGVALEKQQQVLWLGRLLIGCGVTGWAFVSDIEIWVDERSGMLRIQKQNFLRATSKLIPYASVKSIRVQRVGRSHGPMGYQIVIEFKDSDSFNTGRWSLNQSEIIAEAESLAKILDSKAHTGLVIHPANSNLQIRGIQVNQILIAATLSLLTYTIWYRLQVGPWCLAMWGGTAPMAIMGFSFAGYIGVLRRIPREKIGAFLKL